MINNDEFEKLCREELHFLVDEYGFEETAFERKGFTIVLVKEPIHSKKKPNPYGTEVLYVNQTTALEIQFERNNLRVYITLFRLVDGQMPQYENLQEYDRDDANGFGLDDLIELRNPSLQIKQGVNTPKDLSLAKRDRIWKQAMEEFTPERAREILSQHAAALRECAADVLQGNFAVFEDLGRIKALRLNVSRRITHPSP